MKNLSDYLAVAFVIEGAGIFIWWVLAMYFVSEDIRFPKWAKYCFLVHVVVTIITGISIILMY